MSSLRKRARRILRPARLGVLRRVEPLTKWGAERGTPVDRYYIERFLERHRADIRGRVLEVRDSRYTDRFGTSVEAVVTAEGNVLAAAAFLYGIAADELSAEKLAVHDPNYPVVVCVRAVRRS